MADGENALIVFARYPRAGHVKTRLAAAIGPRAAADLYRGFLEDIARRLDGQPAWSTYWVFEPADSPFGEEIVPGARAFAQAEGDLGRRMAAAFGQVLARGHRRIALIGSDMPQLSAARVGEAFARLLEADLVLGPAEDGGYYLVGAKAPPPIFEGMAWGTASVLEATVAAARRHGLVPALLARGYDIDDGVGLERLRRDLDSGRIGDLGATRSALERIPPLGYN